MAKRLAYSRFRIIVWVAVFAAAGMVAGYAAAVLTIGGFNYSPHQASATGVPTPPPGVGFPLADELLVGSPGAPAAGSCTASNLGNASSPTPLTSGTNKTLCLTSSTNGFTLGDTAYVTDVSFNQSAALGTTFEVQVFYSLTPASKDILVTGYVSTSATISATEVAVFAADLSQIGAPSLNGFSVIVTQT